MPWRRPLAAECHSNLRNHVRGRHDTGRATRDWLTHAVHGEWPRDALVRRMRAHPGVFAGAASISGVGFSIRRRTPLQLCGFDANLKSLKMRMSADRLSR